MICNMRSHRLMQSDQILRNDHITERDVSECRLPRPLQIWGPPVGLLLLLLI